MAATLARRHGNPGRIWSIQFWHRTGYDVADGYAYCNGDPGSFPGCNMPNPCPPPNNTKGSGTGWLRTTAPVEPGETMTLTFSIHDEGDHILDSCVIIDNFQWVTKPVGGPDTVK